jgi:UDP-2,3-diacylglucosamine pyrophosphatase LpxH
MKRFILSDLHIGYEGKDIQYPVMDQAIRYISQNYEAGDEILGLGDWFHIRENGFENCIRHEMAKKFGELAVKVPTKLVPGNHDEKLRRYQGGILPEPINHITIIEHFMENGIWYCHGHEYDWFASVPVWIGKIFSLFSKGTPGKLRGETITEGYLKAVQIVQVRAWLDARDKRNCKGIVFGHTHLPLYLKSPDSGVPFLLNDGDMRQSSTFTVADNKGFQLLTWDTNQQRWRAMTG